MDEFTLDELITKIEADKARVRIERDDLNEDYHAGQYRKHGLTKRECELRLAKRDGEVRGFEFALTHLYTLKNSGLR